MRRKLGKKEGRKGVREKGREGGREKQIRGVATQSYLRTEKKRGEMRAGTPAREIREEGTEGGSMRRGRTRRRKRVEKRSEEQRRER